MRVDKWCQEDWEVRHLAARARRLQMLGPSHHMGSSNIDEYSERWVQLEEERRRREDLEARLEAQSQRAEAERQRAEAERQRLEAAERQRQQQMLEWYNWMNGMAQQMGQSPPPPPMMQFTPPVIPPPTYSP
ncbi:unnamed protein product, partial [Urochloa humidicola]